MKDKRYSTATFAAGCFWGVEAAFRNIEGVIDTRVGYIGGTTEHPSYKQVSTGSTGHAEAVEIIFNQKVVAFIDLLEVFFRIHDPTTYNCQGVNMGSQYRSAIFFHNEGQQADALRVKKQLEQTNRYAKPVVTEITRAGPFYQAEEYHQRYCEKHGRISCHL
jgi:peptide-methionine (S)-S-oxide reductase